MKTFEVVLTKSYIVKIEAENENQAKEFTQIYTSDVFDVSTIEERREKKFKIENIDCKLNEIFEIKEMNENSRNKNN